ncbi:FAD-dependent tricarballylate dehydrogenase TcuA [Micromonospora sp. LOL_028]|uniref:FAD-dependent tricarballylate dehydrogenase TcuA n=1 Tax=Micromonospora sp. LOL_028 TaxID=3345420 RepID=UPI003A87FCDC
MKSTSEKYDVIVIGAGNAAFSAAHGARDRGASVVVLEKAPAEWAGGNSYFTVGGFRAVVESLESLRPILDGVDDDRANATDLPPYSAEMFLKDMYTQTKGRCDPALTRILVEESAETIRWLHGKGIRWTLMYQGQSFQKDGRAKFWGGLYLGTVDGGKGLVRQHLAAAEAAGIEIRYDTQAEALCTDGTGRVTGVRCAGTDGRFEIDGNTVVLASGGFEADPRMRAEYLGPGWDLAKVRGTPFNTGDGLRMALDLGAAPYGHWSGAHAVAWDAAAPADGGDRELAYSLTKHMYPLGIVVNTRGRRFLDEGADFRGLTYAEYGGAILRQPGALAFQLFDAKTRPLLRADQYEGASVSGFEARTIAELAGELGLDPASLEATVEEYNAATREGSFDPAVKDGLGTVGLEPPKSNWALPLDTAPFYGYKVTCGITFTYGGLRIDDGGRVLDRRSRPIPGLFAAGELVGGLFYHNYPAGTGLTAGSVFGRRAGTSAAVESTAVESASAEGTAEARESAAV